MIGKLRQKASAAKDGKNAGAITRKSRRRRLLHRAPSTEHGATWRRGSSAPNTKAQNNDTVV
jgi:hypothetical protein